MNLSLQKDIIFYPLNKKYVIAYSPRLKDPVVLLSKKVAELISDNKSSVINNLSKITKKQLIDLGILSNSRTLEAPFLKNEKTVSLWLHITNQCNLRCKYCYLHKSNENMSYEIAKKSIDFIFDKAKDNQSNSVDIKISGGEPLTRFDFVEKIVFYTSKCSAKFGINFSITVFTNSTLVTQELAEKLKKLNIGVTTSLDGIGKYHDTNRIYQNGSGSFQETIRGINILKSNSIPTNITVTITDSNISNLSSLVKYLVKNNLQFSLNFFRENPFSENSNACKPDLLIKQMNKVYSFLLKNPPLWINTDSLLDRVKINHPRLYTCQAAHSYFAIKANGDICGCQMTLDFPCKHNLTNINKSKNNNFRYKNMEYNPPYNKKVICKDCQWGSICCGGCPILSSNIFKSPFHPSPYCSVYKKLIPKLIIIEGKRLYKLMLNQGSK